MTDTIMTQLGGFFELVTFDILLLGLLTLLFGAALRALWLYIGGGFSEVRQAGKKLRNDVAKVNFQKLPSGLLKYTSVTVLVVAACVGMFMNHLADELLEVVPAYSLVRFERWTACQPKWLPLQPKKLGTEDEIKCEVANKVLHSGPGSPDTNKKDPPCPSESVPGWLSKDQSKAFFQHAYIEILGSERSGVTNMLRFEYLVVRLLRVLFVLFLLLTIAAFLLTIVRIVRRAQAQRAVVVVLVCSIMTVVCLWLSGEQQHRYLKKLAYAYLSLAAGTNHNLSLTPLRDFLPAGSPGPSPESSSTPRP